MHIAIDTIAAIILLIFIVAGWRSGTLLGALGITRTIAASLAALFAGRYIGSWLGEIAHRPRFVTIPMVAGMTFIIITYLFHILMSEIRERHAHKRKEENIKLPISSSIGGSAISLMIGLITTLLLFWAGDLLTVGLTGAPIPGSNQSRFCSFSRRAIYEATYLSVPKSGRESQVATMARMISNPALGMKQVEEVLAADSLKQLFADPQFSEDLISGSIDRIRQNTTLQQLFNDKTTMRKLRDLGLLWEKDNKEALYEKLSRIGQNEKIRESLQNLRSRDLLRTDKITQLIREPDFDVIISELIK